MKYLTAEEILVLHSRIIEETGGLHGVRDSGLLSSAVERPKGRFGGRELYLGVFEKATVYTEAIAQHHVFVDGNKRTALAVAARFLFINDYEFSATQKDLEKFALDVAQKKLASGAIAGWLKKHSRKSS